MTDILLFLLSVLCGGLLGALYAPTVFLRRTGGIVGTVISDVVYTLVFLFPLFLLAVIFRDGRVMPFTVIGQAAAFLAAAVPLTALCRKIKFKPRKKRSKKQARTVDRKGQSGI